MAYVDDDVHLLVFIGVRRKKPNTNLTMPVLALGAGNIPTFGGHANTAAEYGMKILAQNVTGITVPNSGHFIQEEQPDVVVKLLNNFFRGNSTTSSK
ncbi:MAG: alpha/beta fold hydrolase [Nitrososphaeraceae archaeon]